MDKISKYVKSWHENLVTATNLDRWGQPVEAVVNYKRLSKQISCAMVDRKIPMTPEQKQLCGVLAMNLELRIKLLDNPHPKLDDENSVSLDKISSFISKLENMNTSINKDLANGVETSNFHNHHNEITNGNDNLLFSHDMSWSLQGSLLPQPSRQPGKTYLTIKIDKIGLKDADQLIDPFLTINIKDRSGCDLSPVQNTPPATLNQINYLNFDVNVHVQSCLEELPGNFAIFFELCHFKPHKLSTKCFSFLEKDEFINGPLALEIYKKPVDVFRHKLRLLSRKPRFLHLNLSFYPPI